MLLVSKRPVYWKQGGDINVELVGGVTNNNGIISNFTNRTGYALLPYNFNPHANYPFEIHMKFYTGSNAASGILFDTSGNEYNGVALLYKNSKLFVSAGEGGSSWIVDQAGTTTLSTNTWYYIKFVYDQSAYYLYLSTNGSTWNQEIRVNSSQSLSCSVITTLGASIRFDNIGTTQIDLSQCYIIWNENMWWSGLATKSTPDDYDYIKMDKERNFALSTKFTGESPRYFVLAKNIVKYYKYQYSTWTQPTISSDGTLGGNSFATLSSGYYQSEAPYRAFDGSNSTQYTQSGNNGTLTIYNPDYISITNIVIKNGYEGSYVRPISSGTIYGSDDNNTWTQLKTFTNTNKSASATWSINMSDNTGYYKYYRFNIVGDGSYARITEMTITATKRISVESTSSDYDYTEIETIY